MKENKTDVKILDDIWKLTFFKKYLGKRRMKEIFIELIDKCELSYTPYKNVSVDYSNSQNNEWVRTEYYELYKSSNGTFRLSVYDECKDYFYVFDLNLNLRYFSENSNLSAIYEKEYRPVFDASYKHYSSLYLET